MKSMPVEASTLLKSEVIQVLARVTHLWASEGLVCAVSRLPDDSRVISRQKPCLFLVVV
jgi:hypothetical protein